MFRRGFTLIELLVVISIISLLSSVVLASLNTAREKARIAANLHFSTQVEHVAGEQAVAIWDFDDNAGSTTIDRASGFNGTLAGGASWSSNTPSSKGSSLSFNGSNAYVTTSANFPAQGAFTLTAWIYPVASGAMTIMQHMPNDLGMIITGSNTIEFQTQSLSAAYNNCGAPLLNKWNFVVGTYDGATKAIYVNGNKCSSVAATGSMAMTTMRIGVSHAGADYFNGQIDQVRIYTKGLVAEEVRDLYASETPKHVLANNE